ncbi:TylF/MycF/NovP-related O-methyltransferase [Nitrosospira multiformis]|uniref:Methyltransferase n=2 Tax=Nitrosospira multiformis TaxID=1231 RepID=Q2Y616_NITMU|nr:TylF/MycF/NovP-related O-methyltransferase [Nitrosospira multiformis]ABB75805.1 methyltransferase [Nitrosospira multiformis ATCC 25196]SEA14612.1 Macrocin-O-methyltransferase (TylF) [Nitrosospira multiformis]SEF66127.1 Macrocin-O-methyltransferase (TylF) [Nitrosospira multiformis ATCC 25196]
MIKNAVKKIIDMEWFARMMEVLDHRSDNRMTELGMLSQAFEFIKINEVCGDYLEFGLWRGKTFGYAHRMKHRYRRQDMKLWGFDSFQGLPDTGAHPDNIWYKGQFACSRPEFESILKSRGIRSCEYELVEGFYRESLNDATRRRLAGRKAAIVYIDCDLYDSTVEVLDFIQPYLVNGSIVCFDDFYNYKADPEQGEQKALSDFLRKESGICFIPYMAYAPLGKSFICRRT